MMTFFRVAAALVSSGLVSGNRDRSLSRPSQRRSQACLVSLAGYSDSESGRGGPGLCLGPWAFSQVNQPGPSVSQILSHCRRADHVSGSGRPSHWQPSLPSPCQRGLCLGSPECSEPGPFLRSPEPAARSMPVSWVFSVQREVSRLSLTSGCHVHRAEPPDSMAARGSPSGGRRLQTQCHGWSLRPRRQAERLSRFMGAIFPAFFGSPAQARIRVSCVRSPWDSPVSGLTRVAGPSRSCLRVSLRLAGGRLNQPRPCLGSPVLTCLLALAT